MLQHFTTTKVAGTATDAGGAKSWTTPNNAKVEDGNLATCSSVGPGGGGGTPNQINMTNFAFGLPDWAVIDGVFVEYKVSSTGGGNAFENGGVYLLYDGGSTDPADTPDDNSWSGTLNWVTNGNSASLWGREWTVAEVNDSDFGVSLSAFPGSGTSDVNIDSVQISVYWHIDLATAPADVPIRVAYKVYSRDGNYLGELPNVSSPFAFAQDMNSAGSTINIVCGAKPENAVTVDTIQDDDSLDILDNNDEPLIGSIVDTIIAEGASARPAIFKNSNRIKVWMYNQWYPNGRIMFSGQVNKVGMKFSSGSSSVNLLVLSDGVDLSNYTARGYPFSYTTEITQSSQNGSVTSSTTGGKLNSWVHYGQTVTTDVDQTTMGAIVLKLGGSANVTVNIYSAVNGTLLGSTRQAVAVATTGVDVQFEFPQLITTAVSTQYFIDVVPDPGQSIKVFRNSSSATYAGGNMFISTYSGGSGGADYLATSGDFYFILKSGLPTTTATYSTDDPVSEMGHGILLDYNNRGGYITERDFEPSGLSLTYTFNQSTILDAFMRILEMIQTGYYIYVDLGTAEMDLKVQSEAADFTVVRGKDINELDVVLSIEQVKNYLLFNGGPTAGVNLYRDYQDTESSAFYGLRTVSKTDNRVTVAATANAIGETFIEENSDETQETVLTVPVTAMDHTLLIPGKTIGFSNFGNFIDNMVLLIVRREFSTKSVTLSLGRMPVRMTDEIQRMNRELLNEQTLSNPSAPS